MNILFLSFTYLPRTGGVERSVYNLASRFASRGHQVTIVTDGAWSGIPGRGLQPGHPADVLVLEIPAPFHRQADQMRDARATDEDNIRQLIALCRERRIEIIHCHLINVDTRYAMILKEKLGIKVVLTLRGSELTTWLHGKPERVTYVREILRGADVVTGLTEGQIGDAREMEPSLEARTEVLPNPIDIDAIRAAVDRTVAVPKAPYLLFAGRFVSFKSIETLIEAYHRLIAASPSYPADLFLAGGGDLDQPLREQAARGPAASRIHFLGLTSWETSLRLIEEAAFLILPSHESEGCPNVLLEAMALGTPVLVSDNRRLLEVVTAGQNGEVFPRLDAAALQACLEGLSFDPARRRKYALHAQDHLETRHRFDRIVEAYEQIYARLCTDSWVPEPITVLMPCKSQKKEFFLDAVESIVRQTSPAWRLLILTDPTSPPELAEWAATFVEERIQFLQCPETGFASALNFGLRQAATPFVSILLSDDRYDPDAIRTLLEYQERFSCVDFFHSARRYIDANGVLQDEVMPGGETVRLEDFRTKGSPAKHLMCWRRDLSLAIGGMDESLSAHGCDDYDFPWRMAEAGARFHHIAESLYEYRLHLQHDRLTTATPVGRQIFILRAMFAKHSVSPERTDRYVQRAIRGYLTIEATDQVDEDRGARIEVSCFRDAPAEAQPRFLAAGIPRRNFFPHRVLVLPKGGPDGLFLGRRMTRSAEPPRRLREFVLYALPPAAGAIPEHVYFDDELQWHQQQFGLPAQVAVANVLREDDALRCYVMVSDLVQRAARMPEYRTRIDKVFHGWPELLLNAVLDYARENAVPQVYVASSPLVLRHTDPQRNPKAPLYERIYDAPVRELGATQENGWWRLEVGRLHDRIAPLERGFSVDAWPKTVCLLHDIERGIGHRATDPEFAEEADRQAPAALDAMLEIEGRAGVQATYNLVGQLYPALHEKIRRGGHALAFHSYDHKISPGIADDYGRDQLRACRGVDYRLKGYRPPQSKIPPGVNAVSLTEYNFEWFASGRSSLGFASPLMREGIVWIPIHADDYPLFRDGVSFEQWEKEMLDLVRERDFVAIGLHDCYGPLWLPWYEAFLKKLQATARLVTMDAVAAGIARGNARWFEDPIG